jgi:ubiquinol-cytochrome c reductase cytochrome b subunit
MTTRPARPPGSRGPLGRLADFLDDRTGWRGLLHEALFERVPGGARWRYVWGSTLVFAFMTQVVTGLFLWANYAPSAQTAWESVYYIQHEMAGGWLLRGIHHVMAQAMVVLLALHLLQVVIDGAYKAPREVNFWLGLVLMLLVLGMALTGYLLPWDQKGYWATIVATNLAGIVPVVGPSLQQLVVGGNDYGHHTLTRFFAIHAGFLPATLVLFLVVHLALFRKHGLHAKQPITRPDAMFWPDQVLKDAVAMLAVLAVVLGVILVPAVKTMLAGGTVDWGHVGAELGAPADPAESYAAARPEWYFLFLFQFLKVFEGWGATGEFLGAIVVPGLVMGVMFLMPIIGNWRLGHRFNVAFTLGIVAGAGLLTALALNEDYCSLWIDKATLADAEKLHDETGGDEQKIVAALGNDPARIAAMKKKLAKLEAWQNSHAFLAASRRAEVEAARAVELAGRPEKIPPTGALDLVRRDPFLRGPKLFGLLDGKDCASCHAHVDPAAPDAAKTFAAASAANLHGFGTAGWLRGLFDPDRVAGPEYFGNTAHRDGDMVAYVRDEMTDRDQWKPEDIEAVAVALALEAGLPDPGCTPEQIEQGRALIADADRCGGCHRFGGNGTDLGTAPDLTGWGSREWLAGIIANPTHERFYGESNDRMPSYEKTMPREQIGILVDWLRGEWYRGGGGAHR